MVDRKLGRGLDFFLSGSKQNPEGQGRDPSGPSTSEVEIEKLTPSPFQPRAGMDPDELAQLAASIKSSGVLQPILVRRVGDRFEIVAGERRWRAASLAGLTRVPVWVREIGDEDSAVFGLVENLQREDLNAMEKAQALKGLLDRLGCSQEELGIRVGMDRSSVANLIRLLDLPAQVQEHVSRGTLSMGQARALLGLPDAESRLMLAEKAIKQGLSVRQVEDLVRDVLATQPGKGHKSRKPAGGKVDRPAWLTEIQETLVEALATPVTVRYGRKRSQIIIECAGREEFERIYERIKNA